MSLIEAVANTASGFALSVGLTRLLLPAYGLTLNWHDTFVYTSTFMIVSTVRSYIWRRIFNKQQLEKLPYEVLQINTKTLQSRTPRLSGEAGVNFCPLARPAPERGEGVAAAA